MTKLLGLQALTQRVLKLVSVAVGSDQVGLALFRQKCYHLCDTNLVQESKRFQCFVNFEDSRI